MWDTGPGTSTMSTAASTNCVLPAGIFFLSLRYVGPRTWKGAGVPAVWIMALQYLGSSVDRRAMVSLSSTQGPLPAAAAAAIASGDRGERSVREFWKNLLPCCRGLGTPGKRRSEGGTPLPPAPSLSAGSAPGTVCTIWKGVTVKRPCSTSSLTSVTASRMRSRNASRHPSSRDSPDSHERSAHAPPRSTLTMADSSVSGEVASEWPCMGASV
mmetsp:Transcript_20661/g.52446  ORF Transcript_20661/g.52446 Transcript_20661/m.52446 type:complete len:213 (-) Transcript_20661:144-782(-)